MSQIYNFELSSDDIDLFKRLKINYKKYNKLHVTSVLLKDYVALRGPHREYLYTIFGIGETLDSAELDLINNIKLVRQDNNLTAFLAFLENYNISEFNINIENFDDKNNDFHMSLSANDKKVHTSGNDLQSNINNLFKKYTILR